MTFNTSRVKKYSFITLKLTTNLLLSIILFSSCVEDNLLKVNPNPKEVELGTYYTDTLELNTYVTRDSVNTTNRNAMIIGEQAVSGFGTTTAEAYFQLATLFKLGFGTPASNLSDYLTDSLNITTTILGDTSLTYRIKVYELLEEVDSIDYFQMDAITTVGNLIGEIDYAPNSSADSLLSIKLDDAFGQKVFEQNGADSIFTNREFLDYVNGIKITAEVIDPSGIGGFLRITEPSGGIFEVGGTNFLGTDSTYVSFFLGWHFTNFTSDLAGSPLEGIAFGEERQTNGTSLDNIAYIQAGTGFSTIVEIPNISALEEQLTNDTSTILRINDANLALSPIEGSITGFLNPPNTILIELPTQDTIALNTEDLLDNFALGNMGYARSSIGTIITVTDRGMEYNEDGKSYPKLKITEYLQVLYQERNNDRITGRFKLFPSSLGFSAAGVKIGGPKLPLPDDFPPSRQSPAMKLEVFYTVIDILR